MRRSILLLTFLALSAALFFLWQYRFDVAAGAQRITLDDLKASAILAPGVSWIETQAGSNLSLKISKEAPAPIGLLKFFNLPPQRWLHVKFQISATELVAGREIWNDGRCIMEWHTPGTTGPWENQQFASVRENQKPGMAEFVLRPERAPASAVLRIENIGDEGEMRILSFEAIPLEERMLWKIGRWVLMAGWIGWVVYFIQFQKLISIRPILAAVICLLMGLYFVVPGPWKLIRSFGQPFQFELDSTDSGSKPHIHGTSVSFDPPSLLKPMTQAPESVGKVVEQVDLSLRVKLLLAGMRPVLHSLLLLVPTFLIACLVGKMPAIRLMLILAFSIEAAQVAFGYGFDRTDVLDLFSDLVGILIGVILHACIQRVDHPAMVKLIRPLHQGAPSLKQ